MQASAVPCERVFSSSNGTDTLHHHDLDTATMEMLQVLKYSLKEDCLSFTNNWMPNRKEMLCADASAGEVVRLIG
ncbi:hypothetical protein WOLCODRAFT_86001 [Wolfiporia cocos MD-104 SS10]|uniref:HAT C-terminal dimerisation domain-containing protein n=1 Tax=Wolfiporia cocos (strain MD-104) TaxID=742152 RepID=A0A2H3JBH1_WOLCO|nr:hypothetical protein WOLCODRAFT_86001 [Wolfiporia cocos MD-104 SS10]